MPEISIVVPVYNAEKYLKYCVDSILNQTFTEFELILVDDGSSDKSGKICDEYLEKDNRIRVFHKKNAGVSTARNLGIEAAYGKYICFVDSDDYLESNYLKELIETKRKYADYDNIWCGFQTVVDYCKNNKTTFVAEKDKSYSFYDLSTIMVLCEKWLVQMPWNKLYQTKIIKENRLIFPPELSLGEDYIFNLRYLDCTNGKIAVVNKPLYNYLRDGKESLDNKYYENLFDIYNRIYSTMLNFSKKWNLSENDISKVYSFHFFALENVLKNTFSPSNIIPKKKKYKYNNTILKSKEFCKAIECSNCYINPLLKVAYKSGNFHIVHFIYFLFKLFRGRK